MPSDLKRHLCMVEDFRAHLRRHIYVTAVLVGPLAIFIGFLAAVLGWALFPEVGWVRDEEGDDIPLLHIAVFAVVWVIALYLLSAAVLGKRAPVILADNRRGYWGGSVGSGVVVFFIVSAVMGWLTW